MEKPIIESWRVWKKNEKTWRLNIFLKIKFQFEQLQRRKNLVWLTKLTLVQK